MLATVRGTVSSTGSNDVVIDVHGVGFAINVSRHLATTLRVGTETLLHTVLIPREDEWLLYGFEFASEKAVFQTLRGVTGVGPRTALAVLETMSLDEIAEAVASADDARFRAVPGIGQKTASLIIVSLSGKLPQSGGGETASIVEALVGLGWPEARAREVARDVVRDLPDSSVADRIRRALQTLGGAS
jgi:Holliday junction DNA helicase RuvA